MDSFFCALHASASQYFTDPWLTTDLRPGNKAEEMLHSTVLWHKTLSTLLSGRNSDQSSKSAKQSLLPSTKQRRQIFLV